MNSTSKVLLSFLAGTAVGLAAATLISKEDREKIASQLKEKTASLRAKIAAELEALNAESQTDKTV